MAGQRAQWKGFIKFGEVSCGVALYTAASTSERITFNTINKATGNRVNRVFIDSDTEEPVPKEAQTKSFEIENGQYIIIDPDEVAATIPESNKTLEVEAFIPCSDVDDVYFDKPYYLTPDKMGTDAFAALRDGMRKSKVAAIARTVLFRRMRTVLIRPHGKGLIATTLNYDYEVRSSKKAFEEMPKIKIQGDRIHRAARRNGRHVFVQDGRTVFLNGERVVMLDQQPVGALAAVPVVAHAHQDEAAMQPDPLQRELEISLGECLLW
ncbi:putative DNA repair protein YkoV [compost metagenome]